MGVSHTYTRRKGGRRAQHRSGETDSRVTEREGKSGREVPQGLGTGSIDQPLSSSPTVTECTVLCLPGWPGPDQHVLGLPPSQAEVGRIVSH